MGKKRKHTDTQKSDQDNNKDEFAPDRPQRTIFGWKDKKVQQEEQDGDDNSSRPTIFRNKEKVLITCSRRINFRYRHLMLNMESLLPHSKRDNKVESKESKGETLNELVELKNCSSCLFFEITVPHNESTKMDRGGLDKMTLTEVGPRLCLNPIKIFGGSFGGPTLYENPYYVSPNQIRALQKKQKAGKYVMKVKAKTRRKMHELSNPMERDEFTDMWRE